MATLKQEYKKTVIHTRIMWVLRDRLFTVCCFNQRHIHIKRQVIQHDCRPSLLGDVDKLTDIVYGWEKHILYWVDYSNQGRTKIFCTGATNQPRKNPCHLYSLSPRSPPFQLSARATPLYSLPGFNASLHDLFWQFTTQLCLLFITSFRVFLSFLFH